MISSKMEQAVLAVGAVVAANGNSRGLVSDAAVSDVLVLVAAAEETDEFVISSFV